MYMRLFLFYLKKYSLILLASLLYAVGLIAFLEPNHIIPGGVTGIAMLLSTTKLLNTGTWYFILNIPLLVFGLIQFGLKVSISSILTTSFISIFSSVLSEMFIKSEYLRQIFYTDRMGSALAGGFLCGVGMGIVFLMHTTTGGLDILIKYLRKRFPYIKTGMLFLLFDVIIIAIYALAFKSVGLMIYSFIVVYMTSKIMNFVLYGREHCELIYIISDQAEDIASKLMYELGVGVTKLSAQGGFSSGRKKVILCAVKKRFTPDVEEIVKKEDENAFLIISEASEIYGEGFKDFFYEKV